MSQSNARASSAHSTASTLRPRTTRLISGLDEGNETALNPVKASPSRLASPAPSPLASRAASPIPSAHPQRASPNTRRNNGTYATGSPSRGGGSDRRKKGSESPSLAGLFGNSWNAVQAIATDLLGNDLAGADPKEKARLRRPLNRLQSGPRSSTSAPPAQWGPDLPNSIPRSATIGIGTSEQQTAEFRARKRKDMLTGQSGSYPDAMGKFKRRLSDDRNSMSAPPGDNEDREALVYLHHVQKDDTLAGITIRYNISANALRKANRMWPNDTILARKTLILPVDACAVKGKPVAGPEGEMDLLGSESEALSTLQAEEVPTPGAASPLPNGSSNRDTRPRASSASTNTASSVAASSSAEHEQPWHHDSWALLPGNSKPTEIARLPRRALGYFPPARRKSNTFSDIDTPSSSLDLARINTSASNHGNPAASPSRSTPPQTRRHGRRTSTAANGYFPNYLTGPGGVGTMSRNVHFPGPAQDGLNKMFAKHLPDVAPPRNQNALYQPEMPLYSDELTPVTSGTVTPAFPHSAGGPNLNFNLEALGGAFENWARRMANKAVQTPQARREPARASVGTPGKGVGGVGDLIEMTDEFEIGGDEEDEEERGRQGSSINVPLAPPASSATSYFDGAGAKMRGRGTSHTKGTGKSGKAD